MDEVNYGLFSSIFVYVRQGAQTLFSSFKYATT